MATPLGVGDAAGRRRLGLSCPASPQYLLLWFYLLALGAAGDDATRRGAVRGSGRRGLPASPLEGLGAAAMPDVAGTLRTAAAASGASAAAARASLAAAAVGRLAAVGQLRHTELEGDIQAATSAADGADEAQKRATAALEAAKGEAAEEIARAGTLAKEAVRELFASKYRQLEPWRKQVLTDPYGAAQRAAAPLTQPFKLAIDATYKRNNADEALARSLESQGVEILSTAGKVEHVAHIHQRRKDEVHAKRDFQVAKAMRAHGEDLISEALNLEAKVAQRAQMIPQYVSGANIAVQNARSDANPYMMPPAPVDASIAYTPPPP